MVVRVTVAVIVMTIVFVVGMFHARRHRDLRCRLRIEHPPEQQHEQRAEKRE
jgi:hypothetical protein